MKVKLHPFHGFAALAIRFLAAQGWCINQGEKKGCWMPTLSAAVEDWNRACVRALQASPAFIFGPGNITGEFLQERDVDTLDGWDEAFKASVQAESAKGGGSPAPLTPPPANAMESLLSMLKDANQLLRSVAAIAGREGKATNWDAFRRRLEATLKEQYAALAGPKSPTEVESFQDASMTPLPPLWLDGSHERDRFHAEALGFPLAPGEELRVSVGGYILPPECAHCGQRHREESPEEADQYNERREFPPAPPMPESLAEFLAQRWPGVVLTVKTAELDEEEAARLREAVANRDAPTLAAILKPYL